MPTHSGYRICKCCDHPGHVRGISGCKHSGQPGYHLRVSHPRSEGTVSHEELIVLDRILYTSWPIARVFSQYRRAYPHCEVEVTRLP